MSGKIIALILLGMFLAAALGCGDSDRAAISGQVTLDGEPVDGGVIILIPGDGNGQSAGWGEITEGRYSIPSKRGPIAGTQKVDIRWNRKTGRKIKAVPPAQGMVDEVANIIPARYNTKSELEVDLGTGNNQMDFELESE